MPVDPAIINAMAGPPGSVDKAQYMRQMMRERAMAGMGGGARMGAMAGDIANRRQAMRNQAREAGSIRGAQPGQERGRVLLNRRQELMQQGMSAPQALQQMGKEGLLDPALVQRMLAPTQGM